MDPLVTVIVPARNEEGSIVFAFDAVLAQTHPRHCTEVVVVDGGSTDRTGEVATEMLADAGFARFAVVVNPIGSTPSNLNCGLEWARGDLIVRVDARSAPPADYIERLVTVMADRAVAVSGGSQVAAARSDRPRDRAIARALNNRLAMGGSRYRRAGASSGATDTVYLGVFRRTQLLDAGGWNPDYATNQDFELNRRMAEFGSIWFEAGLPVRYLPRHDFGSLFAQYHRFGRWKAAYWTAGNRPRPRQWALLAAPTTAALVAVPVTVWMFSGLGAAVASATLGAAALGGALVVDAAGATNERASLSVRLIAGASNVAIGLSWYAGVVRQLVTRADVSTSSSGQANEPAGVH